MLCVASAVGCGEPESEPTRQIALAVEDEQRVVIDRSVTFQRISGFGASSAWTAQVLDDTEADLFFSPEHGLGLSLLRLRIAPNGTTQEIGAALAASRRGVAIWAAPWSPPGKWKDNGTDSHGGFLLEEHYQDWADTLAGFARDRQVEGLPLVALSVQNEPDWVAEWETCQWTPQQMVTFIVEYLAPTLQKAAPGTPIMAPEVASWDNLPGFSEAILKDPRARDALDILAVHSYGGEPFSYDAPFAAGKEFWQTEVSYDGATGIDAALETAAHIHTHLTVANLNAFHYWWLKSDTKTALMVDGVVMPQAYALGHFSKFVRPGYVRVGVSEASETPDLLLSAYRSPEDDKLVVIAINQAPESRQRTLHFEGIRPLAATRWLTTPDTTLRRQERSLVTPPLAVELPATSITSWVINFRQLGEQSFEPAAGGAAGSPGTDADDAASADTSSGAGGSPGRETSSGADSTNSVSSSVSSNAAASASSGGGRASTTTDAGEPAPEPEPDPDQRGMVTDPAPPAACLCSTPGDARRVGSRWVWALLGSLVWLARRSGISRTPPSVAL